MFDPKVVKKAFSVNRPTMIVLNHVDYIDDEINRLQTITEKGLNFVRKVESSINQKINYIGINTSTLLERTQEENPKIVEISSH
jgi:adenylosuccinate synthase